MSNAADAYSSHPSTQFNLRSCWNSMSRRDIIILCAALAFVVLMFRNILVKDYTMETKSYLTSVGQTDAIERVVPKTVSQLRQDRINKDALVDTMSHNITNLINDINILKAEVMNLKSTLPTATDASPIATVAPPATNTAVSASVVPGRKLKLRKKL